MAKRLTHQSAKLIFAGSNPALLSKFYYMRTEYDPKNIVGKEEDRLNQDDFVEEVEDGLFNTGQSYEDTPAKTLQCKHCGGKEFNVGTGNYYTGVRCIKCEYEFCVHSG